MAAFSSFSKIKTAQLLLGLNALIWLIIGIISLLRLAGNDPDLIGVYAIVAVLMFGNVAAMLVAAWLLNNPRKLSFLFALAVLLINILLTFTDQFGFFDLITVLIDFVILRILLANRKQFFYAAAPHHLTL